jgi:signal transduction histidine kinase
LEIATLALWLLLGTHLKLLAGFIGGILLSGALFSFVIGIFLLPLSILGLILIVGILGFTPFFTCFVFLRNGVRALGQANEKISVTSLVMGMSLVIAVQGGIQWAQIISESSQSVTRTDDILSTQQAKRQFKSWCTDNYLNKIVLIYAKETDPSRKKVIAKLYQDITGENIEERLWNLSDR